MIFTQQQQKKNAQNILKIKVECFLNSLNDKEGFILRKVARSREFKEFLKERELSTPSLFSYDEQGVGMGLFSAN